VIKELYNWPEPKKKKRIKNLKRNQKKKFKQTERKKVETQVTNWNP
jgi:hypothetical protein